MAYTVTDLDLLKDLEYLLMEAGAADADGTAFLTEQFTPAQALAALNQRQQKFLRDTGIIQSRTTIGTVAQQTRYTLPSDWIQTRRLAFQNADGDISSLQRADIWQMDHGQSDWEQNAGTPIVYNESDLATLQTEIAPAPSDIGSLNLLYVAQPTTLAGSGTLLTVPEEWSVFVMYGALADLLNADGVGYDPQRGNYCETQYNQGVEIAKVLIRSTEVMAQ